MTGSIVPFPSPLSNERTPAAVEVIVAPLADLWVAWLRHPTGRYIALERTPDEWHALSDARTYAKRHGISVTVLREPLAVVLDQPAPHRPGEISVWPDMESGGCWRIDHTSASGNSVGIIGTAFSFEEAVAIAREAARRTGAVFDEGGDAA